VTESWNAATRLSWCGCWYWMC